MICSDPKWPEKEFEWRKKCQSLCTRRSRSSTWQHTRTHLT